MQHSSFLRRAGLLLLALLFAACAGCAGSGSAAVDVPDPAPTAASDHAAAPDQTADADPETSAKPDMERTPEPETPDEVEESTSADATGAADGSEPESDAAPSTALESGDAEPTAAAEPAAADSAAPKPADELPAQTAEPVCTLSISCATILDHPELLDPDKTELVPTDGWLLAPTELTLNDGESVFDLLLRICRDRRIHLEYQDTPAYGSAYIEGIGNLYEFDCGDLSGWMFRINGEFLTYGCSDCFPADGDVIEWVYTCDLGADVGGGTGG